MTETSQMETTEIPGCNEDTNNTRTLRGGTNHQQVMHKHSSVMSDVEDSDPSKESLNDRYDRTENKSPPTDDEHKPMALFGSPKRSKNYEQNENCHIARGHAAKPGTLHHRDRNTSVQPIPPPQYVIYIQISNTQCQWNFVCDPNPYVGRISTQTRH
jgi:hypothetical protein